MTAPATLREQLALQIKTDNPTFLVWDYPDAPANVKAGRPVVSVWREVMETHPTTGLALEHGLKVNVYVSKTVGAAAELECDNALDAVMFSLQRMPNLRFVKATRQSFRDGTLAGWQLEAAGTSKNVYRSTILTGG
jgi:hypothetical protein